MTLSFPSGFWVYTAAAASAYGAAVLLFASHFRPYARMKIAYVWVLSFFVVTVCFPALLWVMTLQTIDPLFGGSSSIVPDQIVGGHIYPERRSGQQVVDTSPFLLYDSREPFFLAWYHIPGIFLP